jgi:hypothetical protein
MLAQPPSHPAMERNYIQISPHVNHHLAGHLGSEIFEATFSFFFENGMFQFQREKTWMVSPFRLSDFSGPPSFG